jgi:glycosyltransferase 2 family protein
LTRHDSRGRSRLFFFLKLAIGLGLVAALLSRMDSAVLLEAIGRYDLFPLLGTTTLTLSSFIIASARWKILIPEVAYGQLLRYSLIGQFYSVLLPGQIAGEAVKAWRISRGAANGPKLVASVLLDRVIGLIGLLIVAAWGILAVHDNLSRSLLVPVIGLVAALVLGMFALASSRIFRLCSHVLHVAGSRSRRLRRGASQVLMLLTGWRDYTRAPWRLLAALLLGVMFQLLAVSIYAWLASSLGIQIGFHHWMWIAGVTSIAVLLPLSIGGIGLREGALIALLAKFGVPGESAVALSLGIFSLMLMAAAAGWIADITDRQAPSYERRT